MKLENQCASLELCKRLKELGVKQESLFYWSKLSIQTEYKLELRCHMQTGELILADCSDYISAFTVAELGEMLPERIDQFRQWYIKLQKIKFNAIDECHYLCSFAEDGGYNADFIEYDCSDKNEANARAIMLIYLIEQGHVKV